MIYFYSLLTMTGFFIALQINKRLRSILLNTFVLTVLMIIGVLLLMNIPYENYMAGNAPLNNLLGVSVVALALPLYEQLRQIAAFWKSILFVTTLASIVAMFTGAGFALWLGANPDIVATVISKSVTTPIAMAISGNLGGVPALAAVGVVVAGIQGSMVGYVILRKLRLTSSEGIGLAVGATSHAIGTAALMEQDAKASIYSSIALVLCGIISSILAPLVFKLIYMVA
ncbi:CidB/LrgB family autolysis modulator [Lonepinella sp. MS14437]|uniref:CidB/LrgB family autolysis modulator n=1 Tax=Lonepinella sp. MS14437 TaxID=3003620 RepID=UPI0036D81F8F